MDTPVYKTPTLVHLWQTSDGQLFADAERADRHELAIFQAETANHTFASGASVADALRAAEYRGAIDPILEDVTQESRLVISYWQCRDTPGYQPCRFRAGMYIYAGGDAGSGQGPYGNWMRIDELVRHAKHRRSILGAKASVKEQDA